MRSIIALIIMLFVALPAFAAKELQVGEAAPEFTLNTLDGKKASLSAFKGKVVVIGFVDNCEPCVDQAQELEKLWQHYDKNQKVVALGIVSQDKSGTNKLMQAMNPRAQYSLLLDPQMSIQRMYGLRGDPQVVIINATGQIAFKSYGISAAALTAEVERLLK